MMYPFMTLNDGTEIVHSDMRPDGRVKVYIERPDAKDGFHHVTSWLPDGAWQDNEGFSDEDMAYFKEFVRSTSNLIPEFAADGGFENASGFGMDAKTPPANTRQGRHFYGGPSRIRTCNPGIMSPLR